MQLSRFGKLATGQRLDRIKASPNYRDGKFHNQSLTRQITEGYSYGKVIYEFLFKKSPGRKPRGPIPFVKTDLHNIPAEEDCLVWFGHSSYFMQVAGKKILVDPVLSGSASPIPSTNKAFKGTDPYTVNDIPPIDYLFLTHDHYDHLDHATLVQLTGKIKRIVCGLGVGAHLEYWGYSDAIITELDWNEELALDTGFKVYATPARHFSGRGFKPNQSLWLSFLLEALGMKIFIGGDSGYDTHFEEIGRRHGPIDLAILENGQYDIKWRYIHMLPEELIKAATDLQAKRLLPVHSGKFMMANHAWDEPLKKAVIHAREAGIPVLTPMIGELVWLQDTNQVFKEWWVDVQ